MRGHVSVQCSASDSPGSTPGRPRPQSRGNGPGRCHAALTILKSRDLDPKVEAMQEEAGRSRRIRQESLLIRLLKRWGESLQDVERGEERCDSKRLSNPACLQSNAENFDCTSFTLLENIRTDCPHSSKSDISPLTPALLSRTADTVRLVQE